MKFLDTAILICFVSFTGTVLAQGAVQCEGGDTYATCFARHANGPQEPAGAGAGTVTDATRTVAAMNTGDNEQSTTNDFLPLLRLLLNDETSADENRKIGFEWAPHFSDTLPSKLTVTMQDSELYEPLGEMLSAAGLDDQVDALGKKIDAGDAIAAAFTLSKASKRYGRDPEHQKALLGELADHANENSPLELKEARLERRRFLIANKPAITDATVFQDVTDADLQQKYRALSEKQIALEIAYLRNFVGRLNAVGFYGLLDLVDNQPQFTFAVTYNSRDEAVGPDDVTATFAYEFGGRNVNSFRKYAHQDCGERVAGDDLQSEVACLASYLEGAETLAESFRVKVAAEYSKLQRYEFALATPAFSYVEKPVEHLTFTAALSRQLGEGGKGLPRPRFDANLSYEDFSDDPARQDRGIATVTFSYPVGQGFFVSIGAVYATRPEFRGDVDEEISARLGFTYKLIQDQ
jgi:hypothetical protein